MHSFQVVQFVHDKDHALCCWCLPQLALGSIFLKIFFEKIENFFSLFQINFFFVFLDILMH